ncbi:MAG: biotin/lipoyl-containing protein [Candidatus Orphnella occulta]|nr:biotin/lipoyl-containing protein [Candidatus Orphnella occulta]MDP8297598.1 biotin/lipoyl-containing protein [Candidatus Orphnella occulta]
MTEVKLPTLAEGTDKAVVSFWHKDLSEEVKAGDDLVEMLTDKATFNVPAPVAGKLNKILVEEGQEVNVGDLIAEIEEA